MTVQVLVVCTANICRSPAAARALRVGLLDRAVGDDLVAVSSAGVYAMAGAPMCEMSETLVSQHLAGAERDPLGLHASRPLTAELVESADLILTADRTHRRAVLGLSPKARTRAFTVRQAGRLATWVTAAGGPLDVASARAAGAVLELDPLDPLAGVPPLPAEPGARLSWLLSEVDAARGMAPLELVGQWAAWDPDDIGDPHVEGDEAHPDAVAAAVGAALDVAAAIEATLKH